MFTVRHLARAAASAALLITVGCNLAGQSSDLTLTFAEAPGTPIAQAEAQATAAPTEADIETPTATPEPTTIPTPNAPPDVALRVAERYLLNGYFENAVFTYQSVLTQGDDVPRELQASAAFGLGQAALREGLFASAVEALTLFITRYGEDPRLAQAHFLRGDAYLGLSEWEPALEDFRAYLSMRPGLIDSYALERIGDAQLALGRLNEALQSYKDAADASRSNIPLAALRERLARIYLSNGRYVEAIAQYDAILAFARNYAYRATVEFAAAQAELQGGADEAALTRLRRIFNEYPDRPQAYQAMQILAENEVALDELARGRVAFAYGDYETAVEALNTYSTRRPPHEVPVELHLLLGRAYRELGNTQAALTAFQTIIDQHPTDPLFGEALLEQGRTRFVAGEIDAAIAHYLRIADTYDYLPEAPEALWRAGYLYATNDQPAQARQIFERLADRYPDAPQAVEGLFLAASAALNLGDRLSAERFYVELAVKSSGDARASAYLQVAQFALDRGDTAGATEALRAAVQAAPDSYHAARARDIITGRRPFQAPPALRFQFDDAAQIAEAEAWLRETFGIEQEGALWPLSSALEADPRIVRGRELWTVAAYSEARAEFGDVINAHEADPLASYQLAIFLRGLAAYPNSIQAAANVIRAANIGTLEAPEYIARMRYPAYYLDVVLESTERYDLDPLLMYALIRHESLFDTYATAAADEKGLTQVIPSTAEYIAGQLRWPNYRHSVLFRPYAGIEFGAFFLAEQMRRFNNNATAALAAYNAGPGRAINWLELSGGDHDRFMTAITISSTRLYIQRIYSHFDIYRALYGSV
jgi:soluble lytic murein transglycosylase